MTPRERMLATLNHRMPDRVPIVPSMRSEMLGALAKHYKLDDPGQVYKIWDADLYRYVGVKADWSAFQKRANGTPPGMYASMGPMVMRDERTFEDPWGIVQRVGSDGKYLEWVGGPFKDTDDLDSFDWPGESRLIDDPELPKRVAELKRQGYWVVGSSGTHPFKQAWHMRGFENFLCDYVANPEFVQAIYERILGYVIPMCKKCAAAGVDQLEFWGDISMQDRMIVPPDAWRALDKPVWKRIIDETRKVNPDVRFFFHSDGNQTAIVDDIIEVGFDILNPIQPECMSPAEVKAKWGDRITLHGGGSNQRTLPFGTEEDVRREVDYLMRYCAWDGGYIFAAANVISFDPKPAHVALFHELARDYDLSKVKRPPKGARLPKSPCLDVKVKIDAAAAQPPGAMTAD